MGSATPAKSAGSTSAGGGTAPRKGLAAEGGVSGSKLGRRLSDMMADLGGLSLTPVREGRSRPNSQALPSPAVSDDAEPSWTSTSTATPRRPASGIVNNPFPPLSSSGTLPPSTAATSNPEDESFLSRNPSSSGLASLDSSLTSPGGPSRRPSSAALPPLGPVPSPSLGVTPSAPLFLDWPKLYKDRYVLERRWAKGIPKTQWLRGHTDSVYCLQFDEFKVVSGSVRPVLSLRRTLADAYFRSATSRFVSGTSVPDSASRHSSATRVRSSAFSTTTRFSFREIGRAHV